VDKIENKLPYRIRLLIWIIILIPIGLATKKYGVPVWINHHAGGLIYEIFWCLAISLFLAQIKWMENRSLDFFSNLFFGVPTALASTIFRICTIDFFRKSSDWYDFFLVGFSLLCFGKWSWRSDHREIKKRIFGLVFI